MRRGVGGCDGARPQQKRTERELSLHRCDRGTGRIRL